MIRELSLEDLPKLVQITLAVQTQLKTPGFYWNEEELRDELKVGYGIGLFKDQELVSFVLYRILSDILEIELLATSPESMGSGGMRALLQELELRQKACSELWLEVHDSNLRARTFYEKYGFKETAFRPRYYRDGGGARIFAKKMAEKS